MKTGEVVIELDRINRFGAVDISFNETLILPKDTSLINETVLDIRLIAFNEDLALLKDFTWRVEDFGSVTMKIQLEFEYPSSISEDAEGFDTLEIMVINPVYFRSAEESWRMVKNETLLESKIPRQLDRGMEA